MSAIKTFVNNSLGIRFIKFNDGVLTSDGVFLEKKIIPTITKEIYESLKKTKSIYDYEKSKNANALLLKDFKEKEEVVETEVTEEKVEKKPIKKKQLSTKIKIKRKLSKLFSLKSIGRYFLLYVSVVCSCLSIFYTSVYFKTYIGTPIICFTLSSAMFIYSLIGLQFIEELKKKKKKAMSIILTITSVITILFSMYSSADVNFTRLQKTINIYNEENKTILIADEKKNNIDAMIKLLNEEKESIEIEKKDISSQISYNLENDKGSRNTDLNYQLNRRNNRIKEINQKIVELTSEKTNLIEENNLIDVDSKPKTFYNLLGSILHIRGEILQMIVMMTVSIFIDVIAPISLYIFRSKKL